MAKLRVYGFATQNNGCAKFRIWSPLAMLDRLGLAEVRRDPDKPQPISIERAQEIFHWADVVVMQPFSQLWAASIMFGARDAFNKNGNNKRIVVDLDDDIYNVHALNVSGGDEGKLMHLKSQFSGKFDDFWEVMEIPKGQEKDFRERLDGTIFIDETGFKFLHNKANDVNLVATRMLEDADMVTTTNEHLQSVFRTKTKAPVVVLPNCIDFKEWKYQRPKPVNGDTWLGWCGSVSHYPDMQTLMPELDKVMKKEHLKFHVMGSSFAYFFPPKPGANLQRIPGYDGSDAMWQTSLDECGERWPGKMAFHPPVNIQDYVKWFMENFKADIAIAPLENNQFNQAKSELKWVENAALGIPTVASKVGPYRRAINHGEDGLLCGSPNSFRKGISELVDDKEKRRRIGKAAYQRVRQEYCAEKRAPEWLKAYEAIV